MKIQPDTSSAQSISAYGPGWVSIKNEKIHTSLVIGSRGERFEWNCDKFEDLDEEHFKQLANMNTELVIFGSGGHLRFPKSGWLKPLIEKQIGLESMDTQAACRTYNILAGEGRHVALALIIEQST
jgi:uncharacterized protein